MIAEWSPMSPFPAALPAPSGWLYGWVDTSVPGHRTIGDGGTPRTVASGYYRGDALATAINATGLTATIDRGVWTVTPSSAPDTLESDDRLLVALGIAGAAGQTLASASSHTGLRISPLTIPVEGASWDAVTVDSDDVMALSRQQRASGYCWGAVRVWDVSLVLTRAALEAFASGWCLKGRVTVLAGDDTPMSSSNPDGYIQGQVLRVNPPEPFDAVEMHWRVKMRIAEVTS